MSLATRRADASCQLCGLLRPTVNRYGRVRPVRLCGRCVRSQLPGVIADSLIEYDVSRAEAEKFEQAVKLLIRQALDEARAARASNGEDDRWPAGAGASTP